MMIHLGKSQILKRQMAETVDGVIRGEFAGSNLLEQLADGFGVHRTWTSLCLKRTQFGNRTALQVAHFQGLSGELL